MNFKDIRTKFVSSNQKKKKKKENEKKNKQQTETAERKLTAFIYAKLVLFIVLFYLFFLRLCTKNKR